jgi:hypothetical protein
MALAVSLAGQALVVLALFNMTKDNRQMAWVLVTLFQIPLAVVMPHFVHRVLSSFIAAFAFSEVLGYRGVSDLGGSVLLLLAAGLWLNEFSYPQQMRKIRAIGYGLVLALVFLTGTASFDSGAIGRWPTQQWLLPWAGELLTCAVMLYVVWRLLQNQGRVLSDRLTLVVLLGTLLLCAVSLEAQGITVGMVIMLLGFSGGNRVLLGLGIVSLLFYISSYYYLLDTTLLAKSQTLLIVGLVLLAVRWFILHLMPEEEGEKDA